VAPYEADAQMAFLAKSRSVHAVITEDSDLLTYGCPRVRFSIACCGESVSCLSRCVQAERLVQHAGQSLHDVAQILCQPPPQSTRHTETLCDSRR